MTDSASIAVKSGIFRRWTVWIVTRQTVESYFGCIVWHVLLKEAGTLHDRCRGKSNKQLIIDRQLLGRHLVSSTMTVAATVYRFQRCEIFPRKSKRRGFSFSFDMPGCSCVTAVAGDSRVDLVKPDAAFIKRQPCAVTAQTFERFTMRQPLPEPIDSDGILQCFSRLPES